MKGLREISKSLENSLKDILINTGQHYDYLMSKVFFDELEIKEPNYHLGVGSASHAEQTGRLLQKVEEVLLKEQPNIVMVYGDTNSTLGAALTAAKLQIPIAHVEAGLRSFNKSMPEEINRILTDHVSTLLFCPSREAVKNLRREGFTNVLNDGVLLSQDYFLKIQNFGNLKIDKNNPAVMNTGDIMYDVLLSALDKAQKRSDILNRFDLRKQAYVLFTLHRAESTDNLNRFQEIIEFVNDVSGAKQVIFPIHPRTRQAYQSVKKKFAENVKVMDPVGYFDLLMLLKHCKLLMTDSGGMQKEAYWLNVPCITLRDETEWVETVQSGWNVLYKAYHGSHAPSHYNDALYGDGKTAARIVISLIQFAKQQSL